VFVRQELARAGETVGQPVGARVSGAQEATLDPHTVAVVVEEEMREQAPVAVFSATGSGELHAAADNKIA
jgi:hypothetical protein